MNKKLDDLLADALTPDSEPGELLNEQLLRRAKEEMWMKDDMNNEMMHDEAAQDNSSQGALCANIVNTRRGRRRKLAAAAAVAVAVIAVGGGTTYAAWRYLSPKDVATEMNDKRLAAAFEGENATLANETQTFGDYRVTLIGIVSGKSLSDFEYQSGGEVKDERSYWLMAIEHADGTPMPESGTPEYDKESFLSSPFIQGLDPALYNIYSFGGGYTEFVQDGVRYRMAECDNLELFADKEVYLCLADENSVGVINQAYTYDEVTGKITRNEAYEGCNALFTLPLDATKADQKKAEAYLQSLDKTPEEEEAERKKGLESLPESQQKEIEEGERQSELLGAFVRTLTPENIEELCEKKEDSETVVNVDWDSDWVEFSTLGDGPSHCEMRMEEFRMMFPDQTPRIYIHGWSVSSGGADDIVCAEITVLTMHEDGTITCADYIPKNLELKNIDN